MHIGHTGLFATALSNKIKLAPVGTRASAKQLALAPSLSEPEFAKKQLMQVLQCVDIAESKDTVKVLCAVPVKDKALRKLNVSGKNLGIEGAFVVAEYLDGNGAILKFTYSGDNDNSKPVTMETSMTEAYFSGKDLGISGAIMLSAFLPK